jgi:hypothetical protein
MRKEIVVVFALGVLQIGAVPKPVMGRKLGALMGKSPGAGSASRLPSPEDPPSGAGMRSLFRGHPPSTPPPPRRRIPRWYLFGADLLLVAAALMVISKSPTPLSGNEKFFGVVAVVLGASLGLIAICVQDQKDK